MRIIERLEEMRFSDTAVALGRFDGLHKGHQAVIKAAVAKEKEGLLPCVFLLTAASGAIPSPPEIMTRTRKFDFLARMGIKVVFEIPFPQIKAMTPEQFVADILQDSFGARQVSCGFNYHFGVGGLGDARDLTALCREKGIEVTVADPVTQGGEPISSTRIRHLLEEGCVRDANSLLGNLFTIDFTVVTGKKIGRLMGTPTINQPVPEGFILPKAGVYASSVVISGERLPSVTNFGINPTLRKNTPLFETWIPDYTGDLYDRNIAVSLHQFLRPEQKFESLEALRTRILRDAEKSKGIFKDSLSYE